MAMDKYRGAEMGSFNALFCLSSKACRGSPLAQMGRGKVCVSIEGRAVLLPLEETIFISHRLGQNDQLSDRNEGRKCGIRWVYFGKKANYTEVATFGNNDCLRAKRGLRIRTQNEQQMSMMRIQDF